MSDDHVRTAALTRFSSWRPISKAVRRCLLSNRIIQRDASNDSNADRAADFLLKRRAGATHGGVALRQVFALQSKFMFSNRLKTNQHSITFTEITSAHENFILRQD